MDLKEAILAQLNKVEYDLLLFGHDESGHREHLEQVKMVVTEVLDQLDNSLNEPKDCPCEIESQEMHVLFHLDIVREVVGGEKVSAYNETARAVWVSRTEITPAVGTTITAGGPTVVVKEYSGIYVMLDLYNSEGVFVKTCFEKVIL